MTDAQRYGIAIAQVYKPADGSENQLVVLDVDTYASVGDVVVFDVRQGESRRIDAFKLAKVRYSLVPAQWLPTDEDLTRLYKEANGELNGKLQPLTTKRIFRAMRYMLAQARIPANS